MCEHKNSKIKFCKREDGIEPVLYCDDCKLFINDYVPKFKHDFFTHGRVYDLEEFLSTGTTEEIKEKTLSLAFGLKEILDHYTGCECGYDQNYTYIFGKFINEFNLLEYYFLKNADLLTDPKNIKNHLSLFPLRILEKLKDNQNFWTTKFRHKYNIYKTNDYKLF